MQATTAAAIDPVQRHCQHPRRWRRRLAPTPRAPTACPGRRSRAARCGGIRVRAARRRWCQCRLALPQTHSNRRRSSACCGVRATAMPQLQLRTGGGCCVLSRSRGRRPVRSRKDATGVGALVRPRCAAPGLPGGRTPPCARCALWCRHHPIVATAEASCWSVLGAPCYPSFCCFCCCCCC